MNNTKAIAVETPKAVELAQSEIAAVNGGTLLDTYPIDETLVDVEFGRKKKTTE